MPVNINNFRSVLRDSDSVVEKLLKLELECYSQPKEPFISVIYQNILYHILERHTNKVNVYMCVDCILRVRE